MKTLASKASPSERTGMPQGASEEQRHVSEADAAFPLSLLPADILSVVLSHCSPKDICGLACVKKDWHDAAQSDRAWSLNASWLLQGIFRNYFPELAKAQSNCEAFGKAVVGVHTGDKSWLLRADPNTGCVSLLASAVKHLDITWHTNHEGSRYWETQQCVPGSDFDTCALLITVCWFRLAGVLRPLFLLPAGKYKMSWKVAKAPGAFQWQEHPALCSVTLDESFGRPVSVAHKKEVPLGQDGEPYEPFATFVPKENRTGQRMTQQGLVEQGGSRPSQLAQGQGSGHGVQGTGTRQNPRFLDMVRNFLRSSWLASRGGAVTGGGSVAEGPPEAPGASSLPLQAHPAALVDAVSGEGIGREGEEEHFEELDDDDDDDSEYDSDEGNAHLEAAPFPPSRFAVSHHYGRGTWPAPTGRSQPQPGDVHSSPSHAHVGREPLKWELHEVVEFSLEGQEPREPTVMDVKVDLTETRSSWWKSGLYVDAVVLTQLAGEL